MAKAVTVANENELSTLQMIGSQETSHRISNRAVLTMREDVSLLLFSSNMSFNDEYQRHANDEYRQ